MQLSCAWNTFKKTHFSLHTIVSLPSVKINVAHSLFVYIIIAIHVNSIQNFDNLCSSQFWLSIFRFVSLTMSVFISLKNNNDSKDDIVFGEIEKEENPFDGAWTIQIATNGLFLNTHRFIWIIQKSPLVRKCFSIPRNLNDPEKPVTKSELDHWNKTSLCH